MYNDNIIDACYTVVEDHNSDSDKEKTSVQVDTPYSPLVSAIDGFFGTIQEGIKCHIDYKKARESEITERKRIKAQYDLLRTKLSQDHELIMREISFAHETGRSQLEHNHKLIDDLIEFNHRCIDTCIKEKDYDMVKYLTNWEMAMVKDTQTNNLNIMTASISALSSLCLLPDLESNNNPLLMG